MRLDAKAIVRRSIYGPEGEVIRRAHSIVTTQHQEQQMAHEHGSHNDTPQQSKAVWVFIGFLLIAGYFLVSEQRAHLAGWLSAYGIWLFLLPCLLMHMFMRHDHEDHGSGKSPNESIKQNQ